MQCADPEKQLNRDSQGLSHEHVGMSVENKMEGEREKIETAVQ